MRYFPDPLSGWIFLAGLAAILAVASYTDERYTRVPKWLTLPALGLGILASLLRGGWMAVHGYPVWILGERGVFLGVVDGLLFALAGFVAGFFLFFLLWMVGAAGGGDVKLFAALGAWLGPYLVFLVLLASMVLLTVCLTVALTLRTVRGQAPALLSRGRAARAGRSPIVVRFSLVAALATLLVALWAFRLDLGLASAGPAARYAAEVRGHGR